jgi:hypothetical protein
MPCSAATGRQRECNSENIQLEIQFYLLFLFYSSFNFNSKDNASGQGVHGIFHLKGQFKEFRCYSTAILNRRVNYTHLSSRARGQFEAMPLKRRSAYNRLYLIFGTLLARTKMAALTY